MPSESGHFEEVISSISNYLERLVVQQLSGKYQRCTEDRDFLADCACVALNKLPAKYIRHSVDLMFFMTAEDFEDLDRKVERAIDYAYQYVSQCNR